MKDRCVKGQYWSKLLLFGEYSVVFGGGALVVPLKRFSAKWASPQKTRDERLDFSNEELSRFCRFLAEDESLTAVIDTEALAADLAKGWALASDVPIGYGLGSSGTVAAAVYDRYARKKASDALELKGLLAQMEGFFHGSSSGIDPLQCYLGMPFRIDAQGIQVLPEAFLQGEIGICLIDTGAKSDTKPLVESFRRQREDPGYLRSFERDYLPLVDACMDTLVRGEQEGFFAGFRQLSAAQLVFLRKTIPDSALPLFESSFDFGFGVKILGSGGGGYLLCFTDDAGKASEVLSGYDVLWLC